MSTLKMYFGPSVSKIIPNYHILCKLILCVGNIKYCFQFLTLKAPNTTRADNNLK